MASKPSLHIDGGTAPPEPDEHAPDRDLEEPLVSVHDPAAEPEPEWGRETIKTLLAIPFMVAHAVSSRRGPEDAWVPDDAELDVMAAPLHNMANRYAVLRALARFGDPVAFAAATGTYVVGEQRRIVRWRIEHGDVQVTAPDADLDGITVTPAAPGTHAAGGDRVRTWQPPRLPDEP